MFKKISIVAFICVLMILAGGIITSASELANVKDYLNYLTETEMLDLQNEIERIKNDNHLDVVVVITDSTDGKSSREFADDYYDYNGYGVGEEASGLLMLINMAEREVWISTAGKAIDIFTDSRISNMIGNAIDSLSEGRYYDACNTFLSDVREYANQGVPSGQHRVETKGNESDIYYHVGKTGVSRPTYFTRVVRLMKSAFVYIIALVISIVTTILFSLSSKGKITINNQTYEEKNSFILSQKSDDFIRETTTCTKIERNTNSQGTSSVHTGSSGRSHGGGGGKF